ncbi:MAG: amidase family protein [Actinomycetia bacterium]|nr:amidase family protein [Actinomycetes bacterium]
MADASLIGQPFAEVRSGLDGRSLSAMELAEAYLERIEPLPQLNAYRYVDDEGALGRAAQADRELDAGELLGPLHGIPIGIKESFGVEGLPFSTGCLAFEDLHALADADVAALARAGGAVILGVQRMSENAMGLMVRDGARATGANPRHPDFAPGGSSSGSAAATATGLCALALGSDGGGPVRNSAAASGVIGFKPTEHRLPGGGCYPWTVTMLTAGFLARDLDAIAAGSTSWPRPRTRQTRRGRLASRSSVPRISGELDEAVAAGFSGATSALAAAGTQLVEAPRLDLDTIPTWLARMREFDSCTRAVGHATRGGLHGGHARHTVVSRVDRRG